MKNESYRFGVFPLSVTKAEGFADATKEELRVLLALIEAGGKSDTASLAKAAAVSPARTASAVVFWKEAGVLSDTGCPVSEKEAPKDAPERPTVTDEFEERLTAGDLIPESRTDIAKTIRDEGLADLFTEIEALLGDKNRVSLSDGETRRIAGLVSQYALTPEYILTLAAHLSEKGKLTVTKLFNKAVDLSKAGIDTPERLAEYIKDRENTPEYVYEMMRLLGIKHRTVTPTERKWFDRWCVAFGFGAEIIGEAYDITVSGTGERSLPYMDTILTDWHAAGLSTVEECRKHSDAARAALAEKHKPKAKAQKPNKKASAPEGFDPEAALARALERSFAFMDNEDKEEPKNGES